MAHIKERARTSIDPLPTLYDNEIIQFSSREWDSQATYQRLFGILTTAATDNNTPLNQTTLFLDFESEACIAAERAFPHTVILTCTTF